VNGSVTWSVGEVLDTRFLGYDYESLAAPSALVAAPPSRSATPEDSMPGSTPPQVLGAASDVSLASSEPVVVEMEQPRRPRDAAADEPAAAPHAYLRVEGVTGTNAAPLYGVYLNVPAGEDPHAHPELRAGTVSTFGLVETSRPDDQHDAEGLTAVFDISAVRDRLAADDRWFDDRLDVSFSTEVPGTPEAAAAPSGRDVEARRPDVRARRIAVIVG
jgi:tyrosinase